MNILEVHGKMGLDLLDAKQFILWLPEEYQDAPIYTLSELPQYIPIGSSITFKGLKGSGKTFTGTALGFILAKYYNFRFLTNYPCESSEQYNPDLLFDKKISAYRKCVIVFDEIQDYMIARRSGTDFSIEVNNLVAKIRKVDSIFIAISQLSRTFDIVQRELSDFDFNMFAKGLAFCESNTVNFPQSAVIYVNIKSPKYDDKYIYREDWLPKSGRTYRCIECGKVLNTNRKYCNKACKLNHREKRDRGEIQ